MSLQLSGTVKAIFDEVTYPSGFSKIEFVITTAEQYPQDVKFELVKDKCALAYKMSAGQAVTVHFNVRGNEHNGKYYVSLQAWKIEAGADVAAPVATPVADPIGDDEPLPF
jgi:hypothetical protein